jgi:hypothetical protein
VRAVKVTLLVCQAGDTAGLTATAVCHAVNGVVLKLE